MRLAAVPVLLVALLAGCAGRDADPGSPAAPAPPDPVALIGNWLVTGTDEEKGTVLRLAGENGDLTLFRPCGIDSGTWRADDAGLFVVDIPGTTCPPGGMAPPPAWLANATTYRLVGTDRELVDTGGRVVATLVASDEPAPADTRQILAELAAPPTVTAEIRHALRPTDPLPAGLTPSTAQTVAGRWVATDNVRHRPQTPHVELRADRTWTGSDGCNMGGGRWIAGADGRLLATAGPSTDIGCENHPAMSWLAGARRAAIDGDQLIILDAAAKELGRLARA